MGSPASSPIPSIGPFEFGLTLGPPVAAPPIKLPVHGTAWVRVGLYCQWDLVRCSRTKMPEKVSKTTALPAYVGKACEGAFER